MKHSPWINGFIGVAYIVAFIFCSKDTLTAQCLVLVQNSDTTVKYEAVCFAHEVQVFHDFAHLL